MGKHTFKIIYKWTYAATTFHEQETEVGMTETDLLEEDLELKSITTEEINTMTSSPNRSLKTMRSKLPLKVT